MTVFNINNYVKVKLTEAGLDELRRQGMELREFCPRLHKYKEPKVDEDGYSKFQMHDLMKRLGHLCTLGCEPPFDTDILLLNLPIR